MRLLLSGILLVIFLSGCGKPYIGSVVNANHPSICKIITFPAECRLDDFKNLIPHVIITKIDGQGNYLIEGSFDPTQGSLKSFSHLRTQDSTFWIIFIHDNTVFDSKSLNIQGDDVGHKFRFKLKYKSDLSIDAVTFSYDIVVSG